MNQADAIKKIRSREALEQYLSESLGYRVTRVSYPPQQLNIPPKPCQAIRSACLLSDYERAFQVYLFETTSLTRTTIRSILEPFYRHHPAGDYLFIFTRDYNQLFFVSPLRILRPEKPMPALQLRILPVEPANVYHTDLQVLQGIALAPDEQHPDVIRKKHEEVFSVERATDEFLKNYKLILNNLEETLEAQRRGTPDQIHAFAQQFLNRLMFLYFLQRKGWLKWGDGTADRRYLRNLWRKYQENSPRRGFYSTWLSPLFFYAFNKRTSLLPLELPGDVKASFLNMPFLNGGLFTGDEVLDKLGFDLPDEVFTLLFDRNIDDTYPGFLERYNFTIQEGLPLEVEVAVDPEMLGRVYESLINLINEEDRHQAGIFYTPRIEIDYMCRLSLIEYLHEATALSKETLIPIVMSPASEDGQKELAKLADSEINRLRGALDLVRVVDPAVGSGSFLVGMMNVMVQLYRVIAEHQGHHENEFALKKRIIAQNLYGVDVKDWAVRVCELRLWLSLIIESEESQMDIYNQPLLPNLTFKVRQGDSLVEEIAGVPLLFRVDYPGMPASLKQKIHTIIDKKADYFRSDRSVSRHDIEYLEHELLRNIIDTKINSINSEIRRLESPQEKAFQAGLEQIRGGLDITGAILKQQEEARGKVQPQIDALREEKSRLQKVAANIGKKGDKDYFLWDIDFAEVFLEKGGFDICIGNPPYVRQEEIAPPLLEAKDYDPDRWREIKRAYKEQLERAVRTYWGNAVTKVDKKSDLYVYFYYQGLSLLRPGGLFCFINSNSWLDVGYGGSLQQFLLKNIEVRQIIDNHARRSFKESDINTVIVLLRRPQDDKWEALKDNVARFIAYRVPFEAGGNAENLQLQEWAGSVQSVAEFRVYPLKQEELWQDGLEVPEGTEAPSLELGAEYRRYIGGKWGGKYLRAPDIFFKILEKGKGKLVRLGDIAEVRRGFTTGANEFFYLEPTGKPAPKGLVHVRNGAGWEGLIEEEFLKPVIWSMQQVTHLRITPEIADSVVFICREPLSLLKHKKSALSYISYGAQLKTKKGAKHTVAGILLPKAPTLHGRALWYALPDVKPGQFIIPRLIRERFFLAGNPHQVQIGDMFFVGDFKSPEHGDLGVALLNSTLTYLFVELLGRINVPGRINFYGPEIKALLTPHPASVPPDVVTPILQTFDSLCHRPILPAYEETKQEDRREFDHAVLSALDLAEFETAIYDTFIAHVQDRLEKEHSSKAGSLRARQRGL